MVSLINPSFSFLIAHSAGTDEANRNMRREGRKKWNKKDHRIAAETTNRILNLFGENNSSLIILYKEA